MLDDDGKLNRKWSNKKINANKEGIDCFLSFSEYKQLLYQAGIKSSDIGPAKYHLARLNDCGDYTIGNCRFIPYTDNVAERKVSDAVRLASSKTLIAVNKSRSQSWRKENGLKAGKLSQKLCGNPNPKVTETGLLQDRIKKLKEAGIKIGKYGWRTKAQKLWGVSHVQVGRLRRKYPEYFK